MASTMDLLIGTGVEVIRKKLESLKNEKNIETVRNVYDELINQLLSERNEAQMLAKSYKEKLNRIEISDDDINHLRKTVSTVLSIFKNNENEKQFSDIEKLINKDVLKTMQLLGFNYKAAIGEPLTELCASKIKNIGNKKRQYGSKR